MEMTATPEYAVRAMLTIARMPATPEDDDKWCREMLGMFQQQYDAGKAESGAPDLLEACRFLYERSTAFPDFYNGTSGYAAAAPTAIAKATGAEGGGE
jgi:hypothetical protein